MSFLLNIFVACVVLSRQEVWSSFSTRANKPFIVRFYLLRQHINWYFFPGVLAKNILQLISFYHIFTTYF